MHPPVRLTAPVRRRKALPRPITRLVKNLPHVPSSAVVAAVLNLTLRHRLPAGVREALARGIFRIEVRDADLTMAFRFANGRFIAVPPAGEPALRFRVNASDFVPFASSAPAPDHVLLDDLAVTGDPAVAVAVREALAGLDVARTRRLLARAVRHVERQYREG